MIHHHLAVLPLAIASAIWAALVSLATAVAAPANAAVVDPNSLILLAVIAALPGSLLAGATLYVGVLNNKTQARIAADTLAARETAVDTAGKVADLGKSVDGRMRELVAATRVQGQGEGAAAEQVRAADVAAGASATAHLVADSVAAAIAAQPVAVAPVDDGAKA